MRVDHASLVPPLVAIARRLEGEGLLYTLRETFRTDGGVPGYVFDVTEGETRVGEINFLVTADRQAVARSGHMGCALEPPFRRRGYVPRLARGLLPFVRQHGLEEILITCDIGHDSQRDSILALGSVFLDELPADGEDPAKQRFVLALA